MHPEWASSFPRFLKDVGPRPTPKHTIERKDVNGDYVPENCTWVTTKEQNRNMRHVERTRRFLHITVVQTGPKEVDFVVLGATAIESEAKALLKQARKEHKRVFNMRFRIPKGHFTRI
jgi:hypothetical protein